MKNIIIIPFHIGDFLGGTMGMDALEIGAYWLLLIACYQAGENGLPDDNLKLSRIARVSPQKWVILRPIMAEKFTVKDGWWSHFVVGRTVSAMNKKREQAAANALKRYKTPPAAAADPQCNPLTLNLKPLGDKKEDNTALSVRGPDALKYFYKKIHEEGSQLFPKLATRRSAEISKWLEAGADADLDILPELRRAAGKDIGSWSYFSGAIMDSFSNRLKPLPKGNENGMHQRKADIGSKPQRAAEAIARGIAKSTRASE